MFNDSLFLIISFCVLTDVFFKINIGFYVMFVLFIKQKIIIAQVKWNISNSVFSCNV